MCVFFICQFVFSAVSLPLLLMTSGHPSCLDMSAELVSVIQTYRWQCMDCKTCTVCQQPHHEDEMMFCDKCDRGYHTFCVGVDSIPTGKYIPPTWICRFSMHSTKSTQTALTSKRVTYPQEELTYYLMRTFYSIFLWNFLSAQNYT